jgi:hypothetical protein
MSVTVIIVGVLVMVAGYTNPTFIGSGTRPYAYLSVMAIGAMLIVFGTLLWRDR